MKCLIVSLFLSIILVSCHTRKKVQYLQGPIDTLMLSRVLVSPPIVQKGDILTIAVFSDDIQASSEFNPQISAGEGTAAPKYFVDLDGNIAFPSLGLINVAGLTPQSISILLKEKLSMHLKNPYCIVRFTNSQFTILGEVTNKGVFPMPEGTSITILNALGMAGDMTDYGLKDSILVMRESDGKRTFGYLDVSDPAVINSPYYYIRQNDVIIVRTNPKKPDANEQRSMRNLTIMATIVTIATSVSIIVARF